MVYRYILLLFILGRSISGGFSQNSLAVVGGHVHAVGSTIYCVFLTQRPQSQTIYQWTFNEEVVCSVILQQEKVLVGCNSTALPDLQSTVYSNHSSVSTTLGEDGTVNSTLRYDNILKENTGNLILNVKISPRGEILNSTTISVNFCEDLKGDEHLLVSQEGLEFKDIATFTCSDSTLVVDNKFNESVDTCNAVCQWNAQWSVQKSEVDCWFAPQVDIRLTQNGTDSNGTLISDVSATIHCNMTIPGQPSNATTIFYENMKIINNTIYVTSLDNMANISCQKNNSYVAQVNTSSGFSPNITLVVYFQPEDGTYTKQQDAVIGNSYAIKILFNANPPIGVSNTNMYFRGFPLDQSAANITVVGVSHTYRYYLANVNESSLGTYTLVTWSSSPDLAGRKTNFTVILNSTELTISTTDASTISTTNSANSTSFPISTFMMSSSTISDAGNSGSNGLSTAAVAAIGASVGIICIALVAYLIWRWRRRSLKNDPSTHEERDNPLYGTTPSSRTDTEYAAVTKGKKSKDKEEKINPLYESSPGTNGTAIEPAYGGVGQEIDSEEPGPSSSAMNEVTYAAVKKPKRNKKSGTGENEAAANQDNAEVTYAAVNKPKKKDKAGTSDSTVDPNTFEVTYAAVNKQKKNK